MKKKFLQLLIFFSSIIILLQACVKQDNEPQIINEIYQTVRIEQDNVDSPSFWQGNNGENWIITTAKSTDYLIVDDAVTGKNIKRIGGTGSGIGQLLRPNGISVIDNYVFVVERDNRRVQVFKLPEFNSLGTFGDSLLIKPYGIYIFKTNTKYNVFITDNYEYEEDVVPADSLLGNRVKRFSVEIKDDSLRANFVFNFGDTKGNGVLRIVESIYGDEDKNILLIAEEDTSNSGIKVYNFEGKFSGKEFGNNIFKGQVEGITLYKRDKENGFWIITDQSHQANIFYLFDRNTFKYIGAFSGPKTTNTDGIWLADKPIGKFSKGLFFALNNDGNVSAFDFNDILKLANK